MRCLLLLLMVVVVKGRIVPVDEFEGTMLQHGVPSEQMATWKCIAEYESHYDTAAYNPTGMWGIFQISQQYWCSPPGTGCGVSCADVSKDDINQAIDCALTVYDEFERLQGNGFLAWETYNLYCR